MAGLSIKLYEDEMRTLLSLPEKERGKIMTALLMAMLDEEPPELNPMENAVYSLIKAQAERANALANKRSHSGSLGGGQVGNTNAAKGQAKTSKNEQTTQNKQAKTSTNTNTNTSTNTNTNTSTNTVTSTNTQTLTNAPPAKDDAEIGTTEENPKVEQNKAKNIQQQRFEEFWELYPNKKSKQDAVKAWSKIKPDEALFSKIITAIRKQMQWEDWVKENGRYIPHPATWLNGGRWDDVIKPVLNFSARDTLISPQQSFKPSTGGKTFDDYRNNESEKT